MLSWEAKQGKHAPAGEILAALAQPRSIFVLSLHRDSSKVGEDNFMSPCTASQETWAGTRAVHLPKIQPYPIPGRAGWVLGEHETETRDGPKTPSSWAPPNPPCPLCSPAPQTQARKQMVFQKKKTMLASSQPLISAWMFLYKV